MIKIVICGICGRMGSIILALGNEDKEIEIVGGLESKNHTNIGTTIQNTKRKVQDKLDDIITQSDVVIDFTIPEATLEHLSIVKKAKKCIVIGTTGFKNDGLNKIKETSKTIPVFMSPNMSVGVNLLFKLAAETAKSIPQYDIEIVETHHNKKKDAPSGTAKKLAEIISKELNRNLDSVGVYGRQGIVGPRKPEEIGILSVRAGDIVGEHTVMFAGTGERIELTHRAHSRDTFASGALRAAKWIINKKPGLYDMQQLLGL